MAGDYESEAYWASVLNMSLCKFFVFRALYEEPLHGYGVIRAIEERTDGFCSPNEGTVYPILRDFADEGYATASEETASGRRRKVYRLTAKGRRAFETGAQVWREGLAHVEGAVTAVR